jgi:hypothetical protein
MLLPPPPVFMATGMAAEAVLAACCACRFLRHFVPQKPQFMGRCEPLVQWSLQGKKSPDRRFF